MPWRIKKIGSKFHVVNADTGKDEGESDTEEMAKKHLAALYANAGPEAKASYATVWKDGELVFVKAVKSSSARYRFAAMQGGEPVFVLANWSDAARAAAAEARHNKALNSEHVLKKIDEHDSAMYSSKDPIQFQAHLTSRAAYSASDKAIASGSVADHLAARKAHLSAHIKHFNSDNRSTTAAEHKDMMAGHESEAARINAEKVKAEPKKPFWQETHPNRKGNGFY